MKATEIERRIRIDFQKIINRSFINFDTMLAYQWLVNLGQSCNEQFGWNRYGLHQSFHQYSHNNEPSMLYPLSQNWNDILYNGFVGLLCKTNHPKVVSDFLEKERIKIGKIRVIKVVEDASMENTYLSKLTRGKYFGTDVLRHLTEAYKGLELKKEYFHPDYKERLRPRIIDHVKFGTQDNRWVVWFTFSFECMDYAPGWRYQIGQNENEELGSFFNRAVEQIDNLLVPADSCNNCPMWIKGNHGVYLRHGYRGHCKLYEKCPHPNTVKYRWWAKDGRIKDNAIHKSIVSPYYKTKK